MVAKKNFFSNFKFVFALITTLVILLDQLSKYLIVNFQPNWNLIILKIHFIKNTGAGFGILQNQTFFLAIISFIVGMVIIFSYPKIPQEKLPQTWFALFLGGVIGNLIDRLLRKFVVDFIDFSFWPAFNLADACISVSVIGLVIYFWKKK